MGKKYCTIVLVYLHNKLLQSLVVKTVIYYISFFSGYSEISWAISCRVYHSVAVTCWWKLYSSEGVTRLGVASDMAHPHS